jgi:hypothetical protein
MSDIVLFLIRISYEYSELIELLLDIVFHLLFLN